MSATSTPARVNLLGLPRAGLEAFFAGLGEKPFRARQVMKWLYKQGVGDFAQMTDLARPLRERLAECAEIAVPEIALTQASADGTRKWLLNVGQNAGNSDRHQAIEMVYIPEPDRGTLCISSQVGCVLDCTFCSTAQQGFNRNLTAAEIVGQVWLANRELGWTPGELRPVTNVVFMGMGEPLHNWDAVDRALTILNDPLGLAIGARHITVSTVGIVPNLLRLAARPEQFRLALSLHAPNSARRREIMPVEKKYDLDQVMRALGAFSRRVTFEYVLLSGVNDGADCARRLATLLEGRGAMLNLIPYNPVAGLPYRTPAAAQVELFADIVRGRGINVQVRERKGNRIDAACGQLRRSFGARREGIAQTSSA